ncbi:MAG: aminotransferase [Alphaproteobacteria bacterium]|jgi:aspartate/methionine/tyrosine aminotransferase|nr:aminotransferase [Alphaproteobacteria bacterium]
MPADPTFAGLGTTIFEVVSRLARTHDAVNLGQGFPDDPGPQDVRQVAAEAALEGSNQYPPMLGLPTLRQAVAAHDRRFYGLALDWETEVVVTTGATEALAACLLALIEPGDEVVLFQPLYDSYVPMVRRAGGVPRFVTLKPPDWRLDRSALEAVVGPQTRLILLNTPLNPAAKVFGAEELDLIEEIARCRNAVVICDEVYEHIVFDGQVHQPLMARPAMRDRCLRIGSAGKVFSLTGWKVGYVMGNPALLAPVIKAHQFLVFTVPPNLQAAVAYGLGKEDAYFAGLASGLQVKRDRFAAALAGSGLRPLPCAGTYFLNADISETRISCGDVAFCERAVAEAGVAAIPVSAFYEEAAATHLVRFCFAKDDAVLDEAAVRLARWLG